MFLEEHEFQTKPMKIKKSKASQIEFFIRCDSIPIRSERIRSSFLFSNQLQIIYLRKDKIINTFPKTAYSSLIIRAGGGRKTKQILVRSIPIIIERVKGRAQSHVIQI